jgi:energy-coupling factor transporter ATP-binding protein EcfA2
MRLKELTVAGFRGFRLQRTIPLDADIVIIHGPNGSGKSSIVEAVEWLLFGDISRHKRANSPIEYTGEYLRNVHCSRNDSTFVEARVVLDSRELTIRREYQSPRLPSRILIDGNNVDDLSAVGIPIEWDTKPILSQGEIKDFVNTEQKDRYTEIAYILGLDILGEFRRSLMDLKNRMNRDTTISESIKLRDARAEDLRQYEQLDSLSDTIELSPYNHRGFLNKLYSCVKDVSGVTVRSLSECQKALKAEYHRIVKTSPELSKLSELWIPEEVIPISELLESLLEIARICDQLKSIAAQRVEMRQARFLTDGLKLISDSTCPFCLQQTITEARKNEIKTHLKIYKKGLKLEDELSESLEEFSSRWRIVFQDLHARVGLQTGVKKALDEAIAVLGTTSDTNALSKFHAVRLPELQTQVDEVNTQVERFKQSCTNLLDHQPDLSMKKLITLANKIRPEIERVCAKVYREVTALATLKSRMLSSTPGVLPEMVKKIQITSALELLVENSGHVRLAGTYDNRSLGLENLQIKVEEFERAGMRQMLGDLSNGISHYYDKLNPGEPIKFTRLAITSPVQRHVRIKGEAFGKDLNPVSCFSEAHVNCLGLSLYFCQRVNRNPQWKFFVLDDPIQSMDEQHAERLVDTLREISQDKQLIVLTQQKAFCDILDDVFQGQSYLKYSCGPYSKNGPQIESEIESIEKNLQLAKTFSRGSKDDRISKSAGSIRKAMEAIVKELLVTNCGVTRVSLRTQQLRLSRRLGQLETSGFDRDDIVNMRTILPIIDKPHHDDPNWDIHPQKIDRAVEILESLCEKHKIGSFRVSRTIVGRVADYLPKIGVAVVEVRQPFSVGENLMIEGTTTCMRMLLKSVELDRKRISTAEPGATVGIKVPDKVRPNDLVYKIVE